jgi:UPF0042 nucleotide-binding protein
VSEKAPVSLTVITGLSGAGKTHAMGAFEDAGWFCIDNLPPRLLDAVSDLFQLEGSKVERAAVVCDVRGGVWFEGLNRELDRLSEAEGVETRILFLEASDETLVKRYQETRRRHPLAEGGSVTDGIARERELLRDVRAQADVVLDTTNFNIWELRRAVAEIFRAQGAGRRLLVTFTSFGFKHSAPTDADLVIDVRFLENPHYVAEFAPKTGLDPEVSAFIERDKLWNDFRERLESLLDLLVPAYEGEGKSHLVIAFGCTGGRHRSVHVAQLMAQRYADRGFEVSVAHRDLGRPAERVEPAAATDR